MIPMIQMWHSLENILKRKSLFLLPDTENPSRSSLMVLIVVLTFALAVLLVFSTSAYSARNWCLAVTSAVSAVWEDGGWGDPSDRAAEPPEGMS